MTHPFRFGIQLTQPLPGAGWGDTARKLEDLGWSTLVMPDHFEDQLAVGPALAAAAEATTTLRLGALVPWQMICRDCASASTQRVALLALPFVTRPSGSH